MHLFIWHIVNKIFYIVIIIDGKLLFINFSHTSQYYIIFGWDNGGIGGDADAVSYKVNGRNDGRSQGSNAGSWGYKPNT